VQKHFFSTASNCEGEKVEYVLGYISVKRGGEMLRSLRRCLSQAGGIVHLHSLDLPCDVHDTEVLGYVR